MKIAVVGAGAMGCLFGGALAAGGQDVWLVDVWQEHVEAIRSRGLVVKRGECERTIALHATTDPAAPGIADLVLIFTKYAQTAAALESARSLLGPETLVMTLQNGIGNVELIARVVPETRILYGLTTLTSDLRGPGCIEETFTGQGETYLWPVAGHVSSRMAAVAAALNEAGIHALLTPEVRTHIWKKLVINASLNTLTALTRLTVGDLCAVPEARTLCEMVLAEVVAVANAAGVGLARAEAEAHFQQVVEAARRHQPSMLLDVLHGRKTEIECLNGAVVREGQRSGIPTPVNDLLVRLIRTIEATYDRRVQ